MVFCMRSLVLLKPGSLSAKTVIVFLPMNSKASRPPLITDLPFSGANQEVESKSEKVLMHRLDKKQQY